MTMAGFTCPVDGTMLVPVERAGIEIDHCPSCRGVWLDRGELDKILERSAAPAPAPPPQQYREERPRYDDRHGYPKKRKSFLEELFD
ncbi:zf-TFIIB domain-containing protein [Sphingomonas sp. KR3-1]|uniref:TFIIB-type zinc ribbon-containing protein n=1 Tax=Sphingomonas sp. KR3-1 TaxID=3156611 RepID=UPI0032B5FC44